MTSKLFFPVTKCFTDLHVIKVRPNLSALVGRLPQSGFLKVPKSSVRVYSESLPETLVLLQFFFKKGVTKNEGRVVASI